MLLTLVGLFTHGYHLGFDDQAVYLPAIKHHLAPALYPHDSIFFMNQMRFTIFPGAISLLVRLSRLALDQVVFYTHIFSIFLVLLGCLKLSGKMFATPAARWSSVTLIAALLSMPVAGTAIVLVDQYLDPRTFTSAFILFAIVGALDGSFLKAAAWGLAACTIDPLLAGPGAFFAAFLAWRRQSLPLIAKECLDPLLPAGVVSTNSVWREVARHRYLFLTHWTWYELFGLAAPLGILFAVNRTRPSNTLPGFSLMLSSILPFGLFFSVLSLVLCSPPLQRLAPLQPMRAFHLVYLVLFLVIGGLAGEYLLKRKPIRWAIFFLPVFVGMFCVQSMQSSASSHIEWPGMKPRNQWVQAFDWVRLNTPEDAFFALDPLYMNAPGEDLHGFRALAERSSMCDAVKDPAVIAEMFTAGDIMPDRLASVTEMALKWHEQVRALRNWKNFGPEDFRRLRKRFGVGWVILEKPGVPGLPCVYRNGAVEVCRIK